jgi:hypothetical protein
MEEICEGVIERVKGDRGLVWRNKEFNFVKESRDSGKDWRLLSFRYNSRRACRFPIESGKDWRLLSDRDKCCRARRFPIDSGKD